MVCGVKTDVVVLEMGAEDAPTELANIGNHKTRVECY